MAQQRRWERGAERARAEAPDWLDMERLPWWLFVATGAVFIAFGLDSLLTGEAAWQRAAGLGTLLLVVPAQLLTAYRRRRGIPLTTPLRPGGRFRRQQ